MVKKSEFKISVIRTFSAAHALREYKGRCERLHGHNWKVRVAVSGTKLNKIGMVMDFGDIKLLLEKVIEKIDHQYLNEVAPFTETNPTAENISRYIFNQMDKEIPKGVKLSEVEVWESDTSSAIFTR